MSKVDAQRALRDARYARFAAAKKDEAAAAKKSPARAPATKAGPKVPSASPAAEPVPELFSPAPAEGKATSEPPVTAPEVAEAAEPEAAPGEELCGHRSMNGRSCTRSKGHPQKNHRYN